MVIDKSTSETCKECGHTKRTPLRIFQCDMCGTVIEGYPLVTTVYELADPDKGYHFCDWYCLLDFMKDIVTDHFIDLPVLEFKTADPGRAAEDFWKAIKAMDQAAQIKEAVVE